MGRVISKRVMMRLYTVVTAILLVASAVFASNLTPYHQITHPVRLTCGPDGRIYVTDSNANSVFVLDASLNIVGELKHLGDPLSVAVDTRGRIYVGNKGRKNIELYSPEGDIIRTLGANVIRMPSDMAIDRDDRIYVTDSKLNTVLIYDAEGALVNTIGSTGSGNGFFKFPSGIAIGYRSDTGVGEIFVADQQNHRIQVFNMNGQFLRTFGSVVTGFFSYTFDERFLAIQGLAIDDAYRVHAVDAYQNRAQILNATDGSFIDAYGTYGTNVTELKIPLDLAITDSNRVVVANSANGRVEYIYTMTATEVTLSSSTVDENLPGGALVGSLTVTPDPAGSNTFTLVSGQGDTDNDSFSIVGSNLYTSASFNHEAQESLAIRVEAHGTDLANSEIAQRITIAVNDVNEAPTNLAMADPYVLENQPTGTIVSALVPSDPDEPAGSCTFALVAGTGDSGNSFFSVSGSNVLSDAIFDYDSNTSYSVRIAATDQAGTGLSYTNILTVYIANENALGESDRDGDGMSDWWEYDNSGSLTALDPNADADSDGLLNLYEWIADTDPQNDWDFFLVEEQYTAPGSSDPVMRWASSTNREYDVLWTPALSNSFQVIASNLVATPPLNVYTDSVHSAEVSGFYRIKVRIAAP